MKLTADTITDEHRRMLAKVRVAEHLSRRVNGAISRALSDLAYGKHSRVAYDQLRSAGFVDWDNGSVLTDSGNALLAEILNARAEACPKGYPGSTGHVSAPLDDQCIRCGKRGIRSKS